MDNYQIADLFSLYAKLLDIHGENSFKSKSYAAAAFAIEKLQLPLSDLPKEKMSSIKGIGTSVVQKIVEVLETEKLSVLDELIEKTPPGIIEMLSIKGIGPKKINTIWKEMEIESIGELLYACKENRLKLYKGFGEKTQQNVIDSIQFYFSNKGFYLYAQALPVASEILKLLKQLLPEFQIEITGAIKRQLETIEHFDFVTDAAKHTIVDMFSSNEFLKLSSQSEDHLLLSTPYNVEIRLFAFPDNFRRNAIRLSSSPEFWDTLSPHIAAIDNSTDEQTFFTQSNLQPIPPYLREETEMVKRALSHSLPAVLETKDIKGIIHCHTQWSDGAHSVEEMAIAARDLGLEYIAISDHSRSAFYAQGLSIERVLAQHEHIDELNQKLFPFKIFKSIECDILNDGSLDYPDEILKRFDLVIASVHSNLKMNEEKAMLRLMNAIENPYTTILGHLTGRLLLSRPGYPVDHKKIIDACAKNNVVIELNAHPSRLDIDWREINYALEKNVLISINPDSHQTEGFSDIEYGVLVAQKGGVEKHQNLSSFNLSEFEAFLLNNRNQKVKTRI
jgi:DNA polymerase (family 10)